MIYITISHTFHIWRSKWMVVNQLKIKVKSAPIANRHVAIIKQFHEALKKGVCSLLGLGSIMPIERLFETVRRYKRFVKGKCLWRRWLPLEAILWQWVLQWLKRNSHPVVKCSADERASYEIIVDYEIRFL